MPQPAFRWVRPPSELGKAIQAYADTIFVALNALATEFAIHLQNDAKTNVP